MDSYQPIYDAVRSCFGYCNPDAAIRSALTDVTQSFHGVFQTAMEDIRSEYVRPSVVYRARLLHDGDRWTAILDGLIAYGQSPYEAMQAFDKAWWEKEAT